MKNLNTYLNLYEEKFFELKNKININTYNNTNTNSKKFIELKDSNISTAIKEIFDYFLKLISFDKEGKDINNKNKNKLNLTKLK